MAGAQGVPAFALDFDPTLLFTEGSGDFDKILGDLDLSLATDTTSHIVQNTVAAGHPGANGMQRTASDVSGGGLRELFGLQQGWSVQQPQQQQAPQQEVQQQHVQHAEPAGMQEQLLLQQQQQQLMFQQQQQQLLQQQQQQQQPAQGLGVVYQLPSPFMQPLTALGPTMPLQGLGGYTSLQVTQPGIHAYLQQQQQIPQLLANGMQQASLAAQPSPYFTFSSLPLPAHLNQPVLSVPLGANPAIVSAGGIQVLPPGWAFPGAGQQLGVAGQQLGVAASPSAGGALSFVGQSVLSSEGTGLAAAGAPLRRGRGRAPVPAAPGGEKPKGPSQRFRERQKATISSLEAEVTQKLAELEALSAENEMLKLRSAVLEAVTSGREYHMKVIKEHGPPTFDVSDSSPHSNSPLSAWGSGRGQPNGSDCNSDPTQGGAAANDSPRSGSISSCNTNSIAVGTAAAAGAAAAAAAMATDATTPPAAAAAAADLPSDPLMCATEGACAADVQKRSIRCIRQMTAEDIIMHWRQFLQDVSEELLTADEQEEQQRLDAGQMGPAMDCSMHGGTANKQQQEDSEDSAAFTMSRECRWCGCTNTEELHMPECCNMAGTEQPLMQRQEAALEAGSAAAAAAAAAEAPAGDGGSATEQRLVELVNKYSYMTKFVALLNPGVLYSLFGRNLDTGEPAAYTDEHWRNVVARLHLTKQQLKYIVACAELYFSSLSSLLHERQALYDGLCKADGELSECQRRLLGNDGTLNQLQLLDQLSSNLKREHVLRIMLNCFVWGRILTAVQFAKTAVYSHPWFPDVHAMVCVLYEDQWKESGEGKVFPHRIAAAKAALSQPPAVTSSPA